MFGILIQLIVSGIAMGFIYALVGIIKRHISRR